MGFSHQGMLHGSHAAYCDIEKQLTKSEIRLIVRIVAPEDADIGFIPIV